MKLPLLLSALLTLTAPAVAQTRCPRPPTLTMFDVHTVLEGDKLRADRVIEGTASKDGQPLRLAAVRLYSGQKLVRQTTTDGRGHFLLENLSMGHYRLSFRGLGVFDIKIVRPQVVQQGFYFFTSDKGCLSWGFTTD
jgi:hypothetical protein